MSGGDDGRKPGHGKNGRPFKAGNTRDDGSYGVGKYRTPEHGKFQKNDGRQRGKREPGSKNLATIWNKQLSRKLTINGDTKTAAEWLVDAVIRRGITRSDRAAENALAEAARLEAARERGIVGREDEVIDAYIAQYLADLSVPVSEDQPEEASDDDAADLDTSSRDASADDADKGDGKPGDADQ